MSRIVREIDRGTRTVDGIGVQITELVWGDGGRSFEVHRADTGADLTQDGCFDSSPPDDHIADLLRSAGELWPCPGCGTSIAASQADLVVDHVRDCHPGRRRPTRPPGRAMSGRVAPQDVVAALYRTADDEPSVCSFFEVYRCEPEATFDIPALGDGDPPPHIRIAVAGGGTVGVAYADNDWIYEVRLAGTLMCSGADLHLSATVTDERFPGWRARLIHDDCAGESDGDAFAPALLIASRGRPRLAKGVYLPVHRVQIVAAWSHLAGRDRFCRYPRRCHRRDRGRRRE